MLVVFGLNKDIWNQIGAAERAQYTWAARLYLLSCLLSAAAGVRFMHQLSDSYTIGILGGLLVGYIVSVVTRIALITMVSLPSTALGHRSSEAVPERSRGPVPESGRGPVPEPGRGPVPEPGRGPLPERSRGPNFSIVFRMFIIALMSLVVALPIAAIIGYGEAESISANRRLQVKSEFKANHPEMSAEQDRTLLTNLNSEHFPIYVYQQLAKQPVGLFSIWFTAASFLIPFFMLWHLRRGSEFQYAKLNRDLMVHQIETDYAMTLEQSRKMQQGKFGLAECVLPNQAWLDAPFNTRSIEEQTRYALESENEFMQRLKTL
jgi:hypothetical protein